MLDLSPMLGNDVDVLLGYEYGIRARVHMNLDDLDACGHTVKVRFPARLDTIAPSFAQGFFGKSVLSKGGRDAFYAAYDFSDWPDDQKRQVDTGVSRVLMERRAVSAA